MSAIAVRFAPSPTGLLHVGNARGAVLNWLFAKRMGGTVLLRLDDTDRARSTQEYADGIVADLAWLGLVPDRTVRQSDRFARYREVFDQLRAQGRVYACYETPEELDAKRKRQLARGRPPVYDRAAMALTEADHARLQSEGLKPYWRFKLADKPVLWTDMVQGEKRFSPGNLSDPVIVKADGEPLYGFASVVDDSDLGISHVIRGEDHVANTAVQIDLFEAVGARVPIFGHFSLLVDAAGQGLSKRLGSLGLATLRAEGIEPEALLAYLAALGTNHAPRADADLAALAAEFDLGGFGRGAPRFDPADLARINAARLHAMEYKAVVSRLPAGADEAFWLAVRGNLASLSEAQGWWDICHSEIAPVAAEPEFLAAALDALPPEPWDQETWRAWTSVVSERTGAKGRKLFMPLRLALTGLEHGPELARLLPLIGRRKAAARLAGKVA